MLRKKMRIQSVSTSERKEVHRDAQQNLSNLH